MEKQIIYRGAETEEDFERAREIVVEYLDIIGIDQSYMNLPDEFAKMEVMYGGNEGT